MDLNKCLMATLTLLLSFVTLGCSILYFIYRSDDPIGSHQNRTMMEQRGAKISYLAKARLYTGFNFTGDWDDFNFVEGDTVQCLNIQKSNLIAKIQSVDTLGSCIRLYSAKCCSGHSMAYYPKLMTHEIDPELEIPGGVRSVGPCFPNEEDKATSTNYKRQQPPKKFPKQGPLQHRNAGNVFKNYLVTTSGSKVLLMASVVPDKLCIGMFCGGGVIRTGQLPIKFYRIGYLGRVEFIGAEIHSDYINQKVDKNSANAGAPSSSMNQYGGIIGGTTETEKLMEGDRLGHYIGARLGPQKNLPFENIFPQSPVNAQLLREEEDRVVLLVKKGVELWVEINVDYASADSTRPTGFVYRVQQRYDYGHLIVSQSYLTNLSF